MYQRNILVKLNKLLSLFPVVIMTGVRQAGKTTLAKAARPDWAYFDLESLTDRNAILSDLPLFFRQYRSRVILDEVQLYPQIFEELRSHIDKNREAVGSFIITGSSSPLLLRGHTESLAGRAALIEIPPLSANEVTERPLSRFFDLFTNPLKKQSVDHLLDLSVRMESAAVDKIWFKGGYPELYCKDESFGPIWKDNYLTTYFQRDLQSQFPNLDHNNFTNFLACLRDYHGNQINVAEIARVLGVSESSIRRYLEIADGLYFWRKIPALERSVLRSLAKHPKGIFRDSGLFHHLSRIRDFADLSTSRFKGSSFEGFVIEELLRGVACTDATQVQYSYVRTRSGLEVDLIIDSSAGRLPVEIKASSGTTKKEVSGLTTFIEKEGLPLGVVINRGERVQLISENIVQVPVGCL